MTKPLKFIEEPTSGPFMAYPMKHENRQICLFAKVLVNAIHLPTLSAEICIEYCGDIVFG